MVKEICIDIRNASFGYRKTSGEIKILEEVNLRCEEGDFIGMIGLNGSGKSTFLKSISGLLPLLQGKVEIHGHDVSAVQPRELAKNISVVLTDKVAGFNLTCFDAVAAGQIPYTNMFNKMEEANLQIINNAIKVSGLENHREKLLNELSDGLFQKTMIARAIAQCTPVMLLDEPSAFLDYASKHELFLLLKKLAAESNKCVIVSSHDLDLILKYCNKVLLVKNSTAELIKKEDQRWHAVFTELSGGFL
jgi:iron complex transport system ATP-binding protein